MTLIPSERREGVGETFREISADSEDVEGRGQRPIHVQGRHPGHHRGKTRNACVRAGRILLIQGAYSVVWLPNKIFWIS